MSATVDARAGAPAPVLPQGGLFEAKVRGESRYDRVTSFLMAVVVGAMMVVGLLAVIYATQQAYASKVTAPLQIVEVFGGGGGSPDGTPGSTEEINVAGADAADRASNNEEAASDFEEPSVQESPAAVLDAASEVGESMAEVDVGSVMPSGGPVASGKRASKIGTGGPGLGFGPGDGGVRREDRWAIVYNPGQSADEYARQLDALGVELGTVSGNQMVYASRFTNPTPSRRTGSGQLEHRLYFVWQGGARKGSDVALLRKAGIEVGEGAIFQFYPPNVEKILEQLEVRYKGKQPAEIRKTRFNVVSSGAGYAFAVQSQETLR
jgi:hypothetical protein